MSRFNCLISSIFITFFIRRVWNEQGPFDGMVGFSQGSAAISLYIIETLSLIQNDSTGIYSKLVAPLPKFVMLFSSPFRSSEITQKLNDTIKIPSLHIIGEADNWVSPDLSREMMALYKDPSVHYHPGSHFVPSGSEHRKVYKDFVQGFIPQPSRL